MATLPAGTVTFLFSDVEGSTRLLQAVGERYGDLVGQHRRLMRETATAQGGTEIDAQGDAFFFAFTRAREAAAAAIQAQRRLAAAEWPADVAVKTRIGLHTGEPTLGDEGYFGVDVVRGARVAAAAHGGQILVSETTRALLPRDLPDGARLIDLGEHELKDIGHPERLFQLTAPGLADDFPSPRTAAPPDVFKDKLEQKISDFVEHELASAFKIEGANPRRGWGLRRRRKT